MVQIMVHPEGFEPPTLGSEDRCAIRLRHGREVHFENDLRISGGVSLGG